jgi:ATP-binding cassette subfamily B protein
VILDEASSNIDLRTEERLSAGMAKLLEGRTAIVIAHRLSTIKNADKIVVIDGGRIVEQGSHEELLERHGMYWGLYSDWVAQTT